MRHVDGRFIGHFRYVMLANRFSWNLYLTMLQWQHLLSLEPFFFLFVLLLFALPSAYHVYFHSSRMQFCQVLSEFMHVSIQSRTTRIHEHTNTQTHIDSIDNQWHRIEEPQIQLLTIATIDLESISAERWANHLIVNNNKIGFHTPLTFLRSARFYCYVWT